MDIAKLLFFAQQTLVTLFSVTNKLQMQGDKCLQEFTIRQMLAIPALVHAPDGQASIKHLARHMGTTKQNAKQIVAAMERKGYVSVAQSEQDKRAVNVVVTGEGQKAFKVCAERTDEFLASVFGGFTAEDLETLYTLLLKLYCFDGVAREGLDGHSGYDAGNADEILRHHQGFVKSRARAEAKEIE